MTEVHQELDAMGEEAKLQQLLSMWDCGRKQGRTLSAAELCREQPQLQAELERRITLVEQGSRPVHLADQTLSLGPSDAKTPFAPPYPGGSASWPAIPGYDILAEMGRGGMGIVYKAHHIRLNRVVALKMLLAGAQSRPEDLVRFLGE